jgi:hypothetical protein
MGGGFFLDGLAYGSSRSCNPRCHAGLVPNVILVTSFVYGW